MPNLPLDPDGQCTACSPHVRHWGPFTGNEVTKNMPFHYKRGKGGLN